MNVLNVSDLKLENVEKMLSELKAQAESDCVFDISKLESQFDNTNKLIKWIGKKQYWSKLISYIEAEQLKVKRKLYEFYKTEYPLKLDKSEEVNLMILSDPEYLNVAIKLDRAEEIKKFIVEVIDTLKSRQWEIKNYLEYLKFVNGVN